MTQPEESIDLKAEHIVIVDWYNPAIGFVYDISYLHEEWGVVTQTYTPYTTNNDGDPIYSSEFLLFRRGETIPSDFSNYAEELKIEIWKIVIAIKKKFFEEIQPVEVEHFIKQPYSVKQRFPIYYKYLSLPEYNILKRRQTITYIKKKLYL